MQSNQKYDLEEITRLLRQIQQCENLLEFESIKLPFELVEATLSLWESSFHPRGLQQLASTDTDTLEAWAIAFSQTLNTQVEILNSWLPDLTTLPIPTTLKQKISDRTQKINQIAKDKSQLLQSSAELLSQEEQLHQQALELENLQHQVNKLQQIKVQLQATNLESLQQSISTQSAELEPQYQVLTSLQQQKSDLDEQIAALQRQQAILRDEINYWQSRQNRLETTTTNSVGELITLTQLQRERLSAALSTELGALEQQKAELVQQQQLYDQTQQQLEKAKEDFQKYLAATEETHTTLNTHYQSDRQLGNLLPVDRQKIDNLFQNIQRTLAEIDQELTAARSKHEQAQQKIRIPL
jgi:DNA repair exonuclease SbcCD ATPase subunit